MMRNITKMRSNALTMLIEKGWNWSEDSKTLERNKVVLELFEAPTSEFGLVFHAVSDHGSILFAEDLEMLSELAEFATSRTKEIRENRRILEVKKKLAEEIFELDKQIEEAKIKYVLKSEKVRNLREELRQLK